MWAKSQVLILEDDDQERQLLKDLIRENGMDPIALKEPGAVMRVIESYNPVLAIIDLDMSKAKSTDGKTVPDVLRKLANDYGNCIPLVYSAKVETIDDQAKVYEIHKYALFQSKKMGPQKLMERIRGLLKAHVADLEVSNARVIHRPTGLTYQHRVAVNMLMAKRSGQHVTLNDTDARAARRFDEFLMEVKSPVWVRASGDRLYDLIEEESFEAAMAAREANKPGRKAKSAA